MLPLVDLEPEGRKAVMWCKMLLLCLGVASAFHLPAPRRALETRRHAASIAEELGAVQRVDTTMDIEPFAAGVSTAVHDTPLRDSADGSYALLAPQQSQA